MPFKRSPESPGNAPRKGANSLQFVNNLCSAVLFPFHDQQNHNCCQRKNHGPEATDENHGICAAEEARRLFRLRLFAERFRNGSGGRFRRCFRCGRNGRFRGCFGGCFRCGLCRRFRRGFCGFLNRLCIVDSAPAFLTLIAHISPVILFAFLHVLIGQFGVLRNGSERRIIDVWTLP